MQADNVQLRDLDELKDFVHRTLCEYEQLEPGIFPMSQRRILRSGQACGLYFCLHGPRSVKMTSIWDSRGGRLLFYDSRGERFLKMRLSHGPKLSAVSLN